MTRQNDAFELGWLDYESGCGEHDNAFPLSVNEYDSDLYPLWLNGWHAAYARHHRNSEMHRPACTRIQSHLHVYLNRKPALRLAA